MTETLLKTKLHIPITRSRLVPRPQLLARLNAGLDGRLTLVSAPAGFGKTTLIVDWGQQLAGSKTWRLAWYSLDENDNNLGRFFTYFITALQSLDNHIGQAALELLHSPQAINILVVLTDLLNTLAESAQAIALTLDDYHLITNPDVHEGITFLLKNAPPHFHLVIISRSDPPFSLTLLRARHQMTEIRQVDLRFRQSEMIVFLNQLMALNLPSTAVTALEKRTEGWVAGLQMAALSVQGQSDVEAFIRDFTGSHRYIFDYLVEEVLAHRPEGTREFLLQTAVLDRLCAPLCDAVLGIAETETTISPSQQILEQLENANLFLIPLDEERCWYRYHALFADLLQQQGRREKPELAIVAHERASRWFEQAGYAEEAVQYALMAAEVRGAGYERATSLLTQYSENWLRRGEMGKIVMWTERLPVEWRYQKPKLILNHAWALLFNERAHEVEATLAHLPGAFADTSIDLLVLRGTLAAAQGYSAQAITLLEKAEAQLRSVEPNSLNQALRGLVASALAYSYHIHGDSMLAYKNYRAAFALNREAGNLFAAIKGLQGWGVLLIRQAKLFEAEAVFLDGLQIERQLAERLGVANRKLVATAPLRLRLGQIYYEWNRLTEAEAELVDAVRLAAISNPADERLGLRTLAKLRLAQGELEAVPPILAQLQVMEQRANPPLVRRHLDSALVTTRCALYRRQPHPELRAAIERSLSQLAAVEAEPLAQARSLVTLDRPREAVPLLEKLTVETEADQWHGFWLSAAVLLCLAYQGVGEKNAALALLQRAVQMAEAPGYIRLFVDEGEPLQQLLKEMAQQKTAPNYTTTLLTHFPDALPSISPPTNMDPLSPREREVIQLIAGGLTNKEIAAQLVIAPSTVNRHTINIYNKLGVHNRAEATTRAYELGILNLE